MKVLKNSISQFLFLILSIMYCQGQEITLKGKVVDQKSQTPLSNVSVYIPDSNLGTITNSEGSFNFIIPSNTSKISLSHLGYEKKSISRLQDSDSILIELSPLDETLEEIIITNRPVPEILKEVMNSTKNKLKESMVFNTYNREMLKVDGESGFYADALITYHVTSKGKKVKSDTYLNETRVLKNKEEELERLMNSNPFGYDVTDIIKDGFADFKNLNKILKLKSQYDFNYKIKTSGDSVNQGIVEFKPKSNLEDLDFVFQGKVVYDLNQKLILEIMIHKFLPTLENAYSLKSFILSFSIYDMKHKSLYRIEKEKYVPIYKEDYIKAYIGKTPFKKYEKTFEFFSNMALLNYEIGNFDFNRSNRFKENSLIFSENNFQEPFWESQGIVPSEEVKQFTNSFK